MFITSFSQHTSPYLFCFQILHFIILRNLSLGISSLKFRARVYYKYFCFSADICILFPRSPFCSFSECINKCFIIKKGLKRPFLGNNPQKQIPKVNVNIRLQCNLSTLFHFAFILLLYLKLNFCRFICIAASYYLRSRICSLSHYLVSTSFQTYPPYPHYNGGGEQVRTVPPLVSGELAGG